MTFWYRSRCRRGRWQWHEYGLAECRRDFLCGAVAGPRRSGNATPVSNLADGSTSFAKPVDNIGKTIPDYEGYASQFVYDINIPVHVSGKMFVGQRQEGFVVNLGQFRPSESQPSGRSNSASNTIGDKRNVAGASPINCVTAGSETVIGAWTTASKPQAGNAARRADSLG